MSNSNPMVDAYAAGQSLWLDYIQRSLLNGDLQALIKNDQVMGLTSNPAIFEQAIVKTEEYDNSIEAISRNENIDNLEVFNQLAIEDIQGAADAFAQTYKQTKGVDGYVSLEVTPDLAHDTNGTIAMGLDLNQRVNRPNLMIKVPGTSAGVEAFEELTTKGVNVNVTLLFSVQRYLEIAKAYISGLERRHAAGHPINNISSVASFFVSRVDTEVDKALDAIASDTAKALKGKIAIANAKVAYGHFANLFGSEQFASLRSAGALPQRLLWASTGTKNPDYSDVMYVEELIGPDTVNTLPPKTMDAFRDHGVAEPRLSRSLDMAHKQLSELSQLGVSLSGITNELETAGIASFAQAFERLLQSIDAKRKRLAS